MIRFLFAALVAVSLTPAMALASVKIEEVKTPGGLTAWLVEEPSIPFFALEIRFRGGASMDAPGKRGSVNLMAAMLEEGAGDLDAQGFATALESLAARFSYDAYDDEVTVSAQILSENRDAALALLKSSLTAPRFDADALDRVRAQVLSVIRSDMTDPDWLAQQTFNLLAFDDHPYGSPREGTTDSVAALTRDDLMQAQARTMARDRVYIAAVGDITAAELAPILDDLLGGLPATGPDLPPVATLMLEGGVTVVDFDVPQSVAVFGHAGLPREDPDFFAAFVLNQILGAGGFGSRLMTEVREKRGLTYGVYSYLVDRDGADLMMGQVASDNTTVAQAIDVIREEWRKIRDEGVTDAELADAKTYLTGAYPMRFDGNARIARILASMQMTGLGIDYIETRNARVEAVTQDDIRRVAQRLIDPEALRFVVVGQPVGLEAVN